MFGRRYIFQTIIFGIHVSFRGSNPSLNKGLISWGGVALGEVPLASHGLGGCEVGIVPWFVSFRPLKEAGQSSYLGGENFKHVLFIFTPKMGGKMGTPFWQFWYVSDKVAKKKHQLPPAKFDIAPEKWWLEDYFPFGMVYFQGLCQTSGG